VVVKREISPLPESNHGQSAIRHLLPSLSYAIFMKKKEHSIIRGLLNFMTYSLFLYFTRVSDLLHVKLTITLQLSAKQSIITYDISVFSVGSISKKLHKQNWKKSFGNYIHLWNTYFQSCLRTLYVTFNHRAGLEKIKFIGQMLA